MDHLTVPVFAEPGRDLRKLPGKYFDVQAGQVIRVPPGQFVHEALLEVRPASGTHGHRCAEPGKEEHLVLTHGLGKEVEFGGPLQYWPDEILLSGGDPGFLLQFTHGGLPWSLPRLDTATDGEPPRAVHLVGVVTTHQQHPAGGVEHQHTRGLPVRGAVGPPAPAGPDVRRLSHQPRSARRCGTGSCSTFSPTIASPRPREALLISAGSS